MNHKTIYLKDYQAPNFIIHSVRLHFYLSEGKTIVTSQMDVSRDPKYAVEDLSLDGEALTLLEVRLNDKVLTSDDYEQTTQHLHISSVPDHFHLKIKTEINPAENKTLSGLFLTNTIFCTQCESHGFRRMTYFLDRPDVLTYYTTIIEADKKAYPILLSNGNLVDHGESMNDRHWVIFEDPFKKPSYLFALVAGQLSCVRDQFTTNSGREVQLSIYVEKGRENQCEHAMRSLKKAMRWDEKRFGREYDLDVFNIVAVPDFNMGAMENKSLNIFNDKYILADPTMATDQDYQHIESVIAHEYFHNWTGNRITCRDWFQLSLKEGLTVFRDQEFSRDMNDNDVCRINDVDVLRAHQFSEDAGPLAHPVRPESYIEINNFYTSTVYNKGAEVIRMQSTLLGTDGFRCGMDWYFDHYDGQAVTTDDFVHAMEKANDIDLTQFRLWYSQAGTPVVHLEMEYDEKKQEAHLHFKQTCPPTPSQPTKQPMMIPIKIGALHKNGDAMPIRTVLTLTKAEQTFVLKEVPKKPILSLLREFSAPIKINYSYTESELFTLFQYDEDGFARYEAGQTLIRHIVLKWLERARKEWTLNDAFIDVCATLLKDENVSPALTTKCLQLPTLLQIFDWVTIIDPTLLHHVHTHLKTQIAQALKAILMQTYEKYHVVNQEIDTLSMGKRQLKNHCLSYLSSLGDPESIDLSQKQFNSAVTMTDQMVALKNLINSPCEAKREALDRFYQQWKDEPLVIDKWFTLQATADTPDVFERVKELMNHPCFKLSNPNRVRALLGAFSVHNVRYFHDPKGGAYEFFTEKLLEIDSFNPQLAARLLTPMAHWKKFEPICRELMHQQLSRMARVKALSKDLKELVDKIATP